MLIRAVTPRMTKRSSQPPLRKRKGPFSMTATVMEAMFPNPKKVTLRVQLKTAAATVKKCRQINLKRNWPKSGGAPSPTAVMTVQTTSQQRKQ